MKVEGDLLVQTPKSAAGFDVKLSENLILPPFSSCYTKTNIKILMPLNMAALIIQRSYVLKTFNIIIVTSLLDPSYTGYLFLQVLNPTPQPANIPSDAILAQLLFVKPYRPRLQKVAKLLKSTTHLGEGSTGKTMIERMNKKKSPVQFSDHAPSEKQLLTQEQPDDQPQLPLP